jgi:hypothetical protein
LFSTGFLVAVAAILLSACAVSFLIAYGVRRKKTWPWWMAWAFAIGALFAVVKTYSLAIMDHIVYPLLSGSAW